MIVNLLVVGLVLRAGLEIRKRRVKRLRPKGDVVRRHIKLAKPVVAFVTLGLVGGLVSGVVLRGWDVMRTAHGWLGGGAAVLFVVAAVLGQRVLKGERSAAAAHGAVGGVAALLAALAAVAGFVLLP